MTGCTKHGAGLTHLRAGITALGAEIVALAITLSLLNTPSSASATDAPPESTSLGAFALPDSSGSRVISLSPAGDPSRLRHLITRDGRILQAQFANTQRYSGGGTGRGLTQTFQYMHGAVFRLVGGTVARDETCFLAADSLLLGRKIVPLQRDRRAMSRTDRAVAMAERMKGRRLTNAWRIAHAGDVTILLLVFETRAKSHLLSLALWDSSMIRLVDYPAEESEDDSSSVWRVDDGGEVDPNAFDVEFVLAGRDDGSFALSWGGAEGDFL